MADGGIGDSNIAPPLEEAGPSRNKGTFEEALNLMSMVKGWFQGDDDHVYKSFLNILKVYEKEKTPINEFYDEVKALFQDHGDLFAEFTRFLPAYFQNSARYIKQMRIDSVR